MKRFIALITWKFITVSALFLGLSVITSTRAMANYINKADASITCTSYTLYVSTTALDVGTDYTIHYSFDAVGVGEIAANDIKFTASSSSFATTVTGDFNTTLSSGATVTGNATLSSEPTNVFHITISSFTCGPPSPPSEVCTTVIPGDTISNTSWNSFKAPTSAVVWVNAHIGKPKGLPTNEVTTILFTGVSLTVNGVTYPLPDAQVIFDPSASGKGSINFTDSPAQWVIVMNPNSLSDEIFFDGAAIPVNTGIEKGGKATLTFTATSSPGVSFPWQWSAAVYTSWPTNWNLAAIQWYHSSYHAGTPTNTTVQKSLIQGPRGGGGSNFTGSWSATGSGGSCPPDP